MTSKPTTKHDIFNYLKYEDKNILENVFLILFTFSKVHVEMEIK